MERDQAIKFMQDLLRAMIQRKGSDLFITSGFPPAMKVDGQITPVTDKPLTGDQSAMLVRAIMNDRQTKEFDASKECNFAINPPGIGRFRVNAFVQQGRAGAVLRTITSEIPDFDKMGLPPILKEVGDVQARSVHHGGRHRLGQIHLDGCHAGLPQHQLQGPHHHHRGPHRVRASAPGLPHHAARSGRGHGFAGRSAWNTPAPGAGRDASSVEIP